MDELKSNAKNNTYIFGIFWRGKMSVNKLNDLFAIENVHKWFQIRIETAPVWSD